MKIAVGDWIIHGLSDSSVEAGEVAYIDGTCVVVKRTSGHTMTGLDAVRFVGSREKVRALQAKIDAQWKRHDKAISAVNARSRKIIEDHAQFMRKLWKTVPRSRRKDGAKAAKKR